MKKLKVIMIFLGTFFLMGLVMTLCNQSLDQFMDTGLLFVLLSTFGLSLLPFKWQEIRQVFAVLDDPTPDSEPLVKSIFLVKTSWHYLTHIAIITTLLSTVASLAYATEFRYLGSLMAVVLLYAVYLIALRWLIFAPLLTSLELKKEQMQTP